MQEEQKPGKSREQVFHCPPNYFLRKKTVLEDAAIPIADMHSNDECDNLDRVVAGYIRIVRKIHG